MSDALIPQAYPGVFIAVTAGVGLVVGSFLNVVIHRLPQALREEWLKEITQADTAPSYRPMESYGLIAPRSHCPGCKRPLTFWQMIPVLSYLVLSGRCAWCGWRIPTRYPAVELLSACLSALVAWRFGCGVATGGALLMTWTLIALSVIDLETQLLPDMITLPFLWFGLGVNLWALFAPLSSAVLGVIGGYLTLWAMFHGFRLLTGKEAMGHGDFKLMAMLGAWLGWQALPVVLLLSSATGALVGTTLLGLGRHQRNKPLPFGPYLAAAGWLCLMWGDDFLLQLLRWAG